MHKEVEIFRKIMKTFGKSKFLAKTWRSHFSWKSKQEKKNRSKYTKE
jgi:hypothetical protein